MSKISLHQQVKFMEVVVKDRETAWPIRVEMGRMTKKEMEIGIGLAKATLETLRKAEAAGGVAESALKELAPAATKADPDLTVIVHEIHRCAKEHADTCEHCAAIANILDESGSLV